jgi:hypothetical protein
LVRSAVVEVGLVFLDRPIEVALAEDEAEIKALSAGTLPRNRSQIALALGAWKGVRRTSMPVPLATRAKS